MKFKLSQGSTPDSLIELFEIEAENAEEAIKGCGLPLTMVNFHQFWPDGGGEGRLSVQLKHDKNGDVYTLERIYDRS